MVPVDSTPARDSGQLGHACVACDRGDSGSRSRPDRAYGSHAAARNCVCWSVCRGMAHSRFIYKPAVEAACAVVHRGPVSRSLSERPRPCSPQRGSVWWGVYVPAVGAAYAVGVVHGGHVSPTPSDQNTPCSAAGECVVGGVCGGRGVW